LFSENSNGYARIGKLLTRADVVILLVNQHTVPIFIDIANAFAEAGEETILFTGHVETGGKPLSTKIKIVKSISYQRHSVAYLVDFFYSLFFLSVGYTKAYSHPGSHQSTLGSSYYRIDRGVEEAALLYSNL
jgi:hypothetical protein